MFYKNEEGECFISYFPLVELSLLFLMFICPYT